MAGGPEVCLGHRPLLGGLAHLNQALLPLLLQPLRTLLQPLHLSISSLHEEVGDQQAEAEAEEGGEEEAVEEGGEEGCEEGGEEGHKKLRDRESAAEVLIAGPEQAIVHLLNKGTVSQQPWVLTV